MSVGVLSLGGRTTGRESLCAGCLSASPPSLNFFSALMTRSRICESVMFLPNSLEKKDLIVLMILEESVAFALPSAKSASISSAAILISKEDGVSLTLSKVCSAWGGRKENALAFTSSKRYLMMSVIIRSKPPLPIVLRIP